MKESVWDYHPIRYYNIKGLLKVLIQENKNRLETENYELKRLDSYNGFGYQTIMKIKEIKTINDKTQGFLKIFKKLECICAIIDHAGGLQGLPFIMDKNLEGKTFCYVKCSSKEEDCINVLDILNEDRKKVEKRYVWEENEKEKNSRIKEWEEEREEENRKRFEEGQKKLRAKKTK